MTLLAANNDRTADSPAGASKPMCSAEAAAVALRYAIEVTGGVDAVALRWSKMA
jgi:hypothetical protein